jgi:hypothetical protein
MGQLMMKRKIKISINQQVQMNLSQYQMLIKMNLTSTKDLNQLVFREAPSNLLI